MELYILDSLYRRVDVIDGFETLIWSERMRSEGDFELNIISTLENRRRFVSGVKLATNVSNRIMIVETVQDFTDDEGRRVLKVTGPSFESVLRQRMLAWNTALDDPPGTEWIPWGDYTDTLDVILAAMFVDICVTGILDEGDIISPLTLGDFYPTDTIPFHEDDIYFPAKFQTLYDAIVDLCNAFSVGFRFVRHPALNTLHFRFYTGSDRTTAQTTLPAVVFSPDLENLRNTTRLTSSALYKNVAYVVNATSYEIVYAEGVDTSVDGFERRVLMVLADDDADSTAMIQLGSDELAKNRMMSALDGQLAATQQYLYEVDYFLGDLVELRDDDGTTSQMQVTEQIFIHDKEGERSYPTLTVNEFIYPGSWLAWDFTMEWDDFDTEEWDDLP